MGRCNNLVDSDALGSAQHSHARIQVLRTVIYIEDDMTVNIKHVTPPTDKKEQAVKPAQL